MFYGGIDNGNQGALVLVNAHYEVVQQDVMPTFNIGKGKANKWVVDKQAVVNILNEWRQHAGHIRNLFVVLEKAQPMPKQGVTSTFKTGRDFGIMEMALLTMGIPHEIVHPRTWQKEVLKGIEGGDTKARAILKAQRSLPTLNLLPGKKRKPHDGLADGGCMTLYGMHLRPPHLRPPPARRKKTPPPPPMPGLWNDFEAIE